MEVVEVVMGVVEEGEGADVRVSSLFLHSFISDRSVATSQSNVPILYYHYL